ncbi:ATP-dependent helicase HrpB [Alkalispirochaeta americana]|uniref:ATP-dependent helicase HrpB n=1 Tax=Alkalispirochaeta americana TaxID=159291 RepID=A0A1N6UJ75_9SPIO|nr:ATP-dependent helicase HrpB [Alkalispirochaeta americana]SIQ65685.1 ATP-dependent helicase HrpB [Alkalispirochaeta americana]
MRLPSYPVSEIRQELTQTVRTCPLTVLRAPPGTGKSTLVPLFLAEAVPGEIWLLQPRRAAVRAVAQRLRTLAGETAPVGWITRDGRDLPRNCRILVMTEGVFLRRLVANPELRGVSCLLLDEFHERSLAVDLSFVLARQAQDVFAPHLRILILSATLDAAWVRSLGVPVLEAEAKSHHLEIRYLPPGPGESEIDQAAGVALARLRRGRQGILVFLPGEGEIRRCLERLKRNAPEATVLPLYGRQTPGEQNRALEPPKEGEQRIVVATNVAETSLTIPGITCVIDGGLRRRPVIDRGRGVRRMVTDRISQASAVQRAGRAGRTGPGEALRLWPETEQLRPFDPPEITTADLAGLLLVLAAWGDISRDHYSWPDPPPAEHLLEARELLADLGALDPRGTITPRGEALYQLPLEPRLAAMVLDARDSARAPVLAALLEEGEILQPHAASRAGANLEGRLEILEHHDLDQGSESDDLRPGAARRIKTEARRIQGVLRKIPGKLSGEERGRVEGWSGLLVSAFPDRVGRRLEGNRYRLIRGGEFRLLPGRDGFAPDWIVAAELQQGPAGASIQLAMSLEEPLLSSLVADRETVQDEFFLQDGLVRVRRQRYLGDILLSGTPLALKEAGRARDALVDLVRREGISCLGWSDSARRLQKRLIFLWSHRVRLGQDWPDLSDQGLEETLDEWLPSVLSDSPGADCLKAVSMVPVLQGRVPWDILPLLDRLAPDFFRLPDGFRQRLRYEGDRWILSARIQQLFGLVDLPRPAGIPLEVELLSPARRPVQRTSDLAGFWRSTYQEVRRELRGRYPKHAWPENPLEIPSGEGSRSRRRQ